jgi:hypothetical protein
MISDLSKTRGRGPSVIAGQKTPGRHSRFPASASGNPGRNGSCSAGKRSRPAPTPASNRSPASASASTPRKSGTNKPSTSRGPYLTDEQFEQTYEMLRIPPQLDGGKVLGTVFVNEHRLLDPDDAPAALIECATRRSVFSSAIPSSSQSRSPSPAARESSTSSCPMTKNDRYPRG